MKLGLDIGSSYLNAVIQKGNQTERLTRRIEGNIPQKTLETLIELFDKVEVEDGEECEIGMTGINSKVISKIIGINPTLDSVSISKALKKLNYQANTVLEMGKEISSYYLFDNTNGTPKVLDFERNSICSSGAGALIEKMSKRFKFYDLNDFVKKAESSKTIPKISGRCSVFAESDVVHLFQRGIDHESIAAGLCQMQSRNFKNNICKTKKIIPPIYLIGGVANNTAVVNFLREQLGEEIIVPEEFEYLKAIGAMQSDSPKITISQIKKRLKANSQKKIPSSNLPPLIWKREYDEDLPYEIIEQGNSSKVLLSENKSYIFPKDKKVNAFLGLDVGSVSTKAAILDEKGELILGLYQRTNGKPIEAVKEVMKKIGDLKLDGTKINDLVTILESGTTGSGRGVAGKIIGAGIVKNEITAQAQGASYFFPDADTIFEIGGQDSKYISINDGRIIESEMNKVCAASTGSFLEEQASGLGISIEKEFANYAKESKSPCNLSEKCAVFMVSSLNTFSGASLEDKCAGLTFSIVQNYLNRVAKKETIGNKIVFQGAVAFNKAIVSAFETTLKKEISVPKYPHLTGAIGIAKIAKETYQKQNGI